MGGECLLPAIKEESAMLGCEHRAATLSHDLDSPRSVSEKAITGTGERK